MNYDINKIRADFPILYQKIYNRPLVYFDNAATTQKPKAVIDAIVKYYSTENSNIHRGVHYLSQKATVAFEDARKNIQNFINAEHSHEIIFTRGTTESINLVADSFGKSMLSEGDEIIISEMEHHSNIVPWQMACKRAGAKLKIIKTNDKGELLIDELENIINERTKLIAVTHISNALGTINPVKEIITTAHKHDIPILIDGAQGVSHLEVDVKDLDCDFYCFSGHKMYGPMGVGVLYGKEEILEKLPPYQGGGEMIKTVTLEKSTYSELPFKFEAGTPNVEAVLGLNAAIDYISGIGMKNIAKWEDDLLKYGTEQFNNIDELRIIGEAEQKSAIISFVFDDIHPYDAGTLIDKLGIAVRTGHHCAQPIMDRFKIPGTLRASFAMYNTREEIDVLIAAIVRVKEMFA